MKRTRSYRLLSKTSFIYLIFTFIAFLSSALFLNSEADEFIGKNLDARFGKTEDRIRRYIEAGKPIEQLHSSTEVTLLTQAALPGRYPVFSDTLLNNPELDEMHRYRKKTTVLKIEDQYYKVAMAKSVEDFLRLQNDIFGSLIPAFILLAIGVVIFNYFLAGYLFRPFNKILDLMKAYKVGQKSEIEKIETNTVEFQKMQGLFHQMVDRIEHDYRHLKEYTENMAHEMQTPLSVIRNKTETLISDEAMMQRHAETVKIVYDETNHLSKLSNTLNLLTKIENEEFSNKIEIKTRPVIKKHVVAVNELAHLKSLTIDTELSDDHNLNIDPFLLDIIIKNLLRNAISYGTDDGPIHIKTGKDYLLISNYGQPLDIPSEKLFERFYRNQSQNASLGLGLSLVKKICDLNDLKISYDYKDGQHTFVIANSNRAI